MTEKITHAGGTELTYNRQNRASDITTQLTELSSLYNTIPNTKFKITSIAPVSLHKHITHQQNKNKLHNSIFTHEHLCQQQAQLEEDIHEINTNISHINKCHRVRSIRWDRDIIKVTIKKRGRNGKNKKRFLQYTYGAMPDGVHAGDWLKSKWFAGLCRTYLADKASYEAPESSDDDNEDTGNWDFKRRKVTVC